MLDGPFAIEAPFWEGLAAGQLRIQRCSQCAAWHWPPVPRCPECGSYELHWDETEAVGTVYSWTEIQKAYHPRLEGATPFTVLLVELPGAGNARLMGRFEGSVEDLAVGIAVVGETRPAAPLTADMPTLVWKLAAGSASQPNGQGTNGQGASS